MVVKRENSYIWNFYLTRIPLQSITITVWRLKINRYKNSKDFLEKNLSIFPEKKWKIPIVYGVDGEITCRFDENDSHDPVKIKHLNSSFHEFFNNKIFHSKIVRFVEKLKNLNT